MQLQCFKQIGSDQSYRLTIWGRMILFQTEAICGARTEGKLIVLVQTVGVRSVCVCVCMWISTLMCVWVTPH